MSTLNDDLANSEKRRGFGSMFAPFKDRRLIVALASAVATIVAFRLLAVALVDRMWFASHSAEMVWSGVSLTRFGLGLAGAIWIVLVVGGSLLHASRNGGSIKTNLYAAQFNKRVRGRKKLLAIAVVGWCVWKYGVSLRFGWQDWLLWRNGTETGTIDPIFGRDISAYLFDLPLIDRVIGIAAIGITLAFAISAVTYIVNGGIGVRGVLPKSISRVAGRHLALLVAAWLAVAAIRVGWLYRLRLAVTPAGGFSGASYVDDHLRSPLYAVSGVALLAAALVVALMALRRGTEEGAPLAEMAESVDLADLAESDGPAAPRVPRWTKWLAGIYVAAMLFGLVLPTVVQTVVVTPARAEHEAPYIAAHRKATLDAFGISDVEIEPAKPSAAPIEQLANTPLLDASRATGTFRALRERQNLTVSNVVIDRYPLENASAPTPVALAPQMPDRAYMTSSWEEAHLVHTHGDGLVAAAADEFDSNGRPSFIDLDAQEAQSALRLSNPDLYFGPGVENWYAVINTARTDASSHASTADEPDLKIGTFWPRVLAATAFAEPSIVLSDYLTADSGILFKRSISERLTAIAPYLTQTGQPQPVIVDGSIVWMADLLTTSSTYPAAQFATVSTTNGDSQNVNYVRGSVKATVDAVTGQVHLYRMDELIGLPDPILDAYARAFPDLFEHADAMPKQLRSHLLYPPAVLGAQTAMIGRYRAEDPATVLDRTAEWTISPDVGNTVAAKSAGTLPSSNALATDGESTDLVRQAILVPGQPGAQRPETAAIVTVDQRFDRYGTISVAAFGDKSDVKYADSPTAMQRTIDADTRISWELTQLNQAGSAVSFGPLVIETVGDELVGIRPVYVSGSGSGSFARLLAVAVVRGGKAVLAPTLAEGLAALDDPALADRLSDALLPTVSSPGPTKSVPTTTTRPEAGP